jgi:hypothetical protein
MKVRVATAVLLFAVPASGCNRELDLCKPIGAVHSEATTVFPAQHWAQELRKDASHLYWLVDNPGNDFSGDRVTVWKGPKDGSSQPVALTRGQLTTFALDDADVFVGEKRTGSVLRVPKAGGAAVTIYTAMPPTESAVIGFYKIEKLALDATHVFALVDAHEHPLLVRIPKAGGPAKEIDISSVGPTGFFVDGASLYLWSSGSERDKTAFQVLQMSKDLGPGKVVFQGPAHAVYDVQLIDGWLYWCSQYAVMKAPLAGGARSWLASGKVDALSIDRTHVYFTSEGYVSRAPLAGGAVQRVVKTEAIWFTGDERSVFFATPADDGVIGRAAK